MVKSKEGEVSSATRTHVLSLKLRELADRIYQTKRNQAELLIVSADRLDELDERVAIMAEPRTANGSELEFPPSDNELGGD